MSSFTSGLQDPRSGQTVMIGRHPRSRLVKSGKIGVDVSSLPGLLESPEETEDSGNLIYRGPGGF